MLKNYLKIAVRVLWRQKVFTTINIFSLALGIACCVLLLLFIQHELSFDTFHRHADRLYRLIEVEWRPGNEKLAMAFQPLPLGPALAAEIPEVEQSVRIFTGGGSATYGDKTFAEDFIFTDPAFFEIFNFPLLLGDPATALSSPSAAVITRRLAQKYFGDDDPIGKRVSTRNWRGTADVIIHGVVENPPGNSSIQFDFIMHISQYPNYERDQNRWNNFNGSTFVLLQDGATADDVHNKTPAFVDKYWSDLRQRQQDRGSLAPGDDALQLRLQPIAAIHLDTSVKYSPEPTSNPLYTYILAGIALLVLVIACSNFVMLAVGRSTTRAKEVGVRKVLGARRSQLVRQFWGEAVLLSALALVLGVGMAELFLPVFSRLAGKELALNLLSGDAVIVAIAGLLLLVALLAGSYPAAVLSHFQPVAVLKGASATQRRGLLTRVLVVFQFGLAIFLITGTLFMAQQQRFISTRDLGFEPENVVAIRSFGGASDEGEKRMLRLREALTGYPQVLGVTGTSASFNQGWDINRFGCEGAEISAFVYRVDYDYFDMLSIELVEGRQFSRQHKTDVSDAVIVNEAMVREKQWSEPVVGQRLCGWNEKAVPGGPVVVGVVKDFHFLSLRDEIRPAMFLLDPDWGINDVLVRISLGDIAATLDLIETKWRDIAPNTPFEYSFVDDDLARQYEEETRWQSILAYSASFAILLACLGLFGLATLAASNRIKEIGIRKVLGASAGSVVALLSMDFVKLVLLANVIAWPVAYFVVNKWLQTFAYRIEVSWWVFVLAGGLALLIALMTVSFHAIRAALANPVDSLRYE